ncbi:MAG: LolA family protein [Bacillota bacterium]
MKRWISCLVLTLLTGLMAHAQTPTTSPSNNASLDPILDALHARGVGLKDFTADVSLAESDTLGTGNSTLTGKVWYQAKGEGDARMRVLFDKKQIGKRIDPSAKVEYLLDKGWLVDRDYKNKVQVDRQVLKPGQKINLLKLGEGPFPLPIGQPREEVLKMFEVKQIDPSQEDPANTVHIQLTPKPDSQFARKFQTIDVWVDTQNHFPVRIETLDPNGTEVRTTNLSNIQVNQGIGDRQFTLEKIGNDWKMRSEELEQ